jgi:acyl transferase domain-containing protein
VPAERRDAESLYDPDANAAGKMSTRWGGFLSGIDQFDPGFFGITPREAERMDPQQRLLLEVAWEALEDAGLPLERLAGGAGGVFVGVHSHSNDYSWMQLRNLSGIGTHTGIGTAHSILANRLSFWLDLRGPSLTVDTACSSSLVALHLACNSVRAGESDFALAAGVNLVLTPEASVTFSKLRMMSADGRCKTFDARADGFVRGEGCGLVVLKRLSDAQAAGDPVIAVLAGSAVNQDGATNGLTAPNGLSQQLVVRRALDSAGVDPALVTLVETHGTGTPLGDPIEVDALAQVLGHAGSTPCALGAAKTNIGHLEAAAGIAGVIKTLLALKHETIPANLHFQTLNPHISLTGTRFFIPTKACAWPAGRDRHAGVSSFGFGGSNAHVVLRELTAAEAGASTEAAASALAVGERALTSTSHSESTAGVGAATPATYLLPFSARSAPALRALAEQYAQLLSASPAPLGDLCHTAGTRRTHHEHRIALAGSSLEELSGALAAFLRGTAHPDAFQGRARSSGQRSLVFVFSGQGSQWAGMGRSLAHEPAFRSRLEEVDHLLRPLAGWSVIDELWAPADRSRLEHTEFAQPAIFALQVALAELLRSWGILPDAVVGHSVGEVSAAHVAGVLGLADAVQVVFHRGRLMQQATDGGTMASIALPRADVEELLAGGKGRLFLGAVNSPTATVLTGDPAAIAAVVTRATERGAAARLLPVRYAFHSPQMEPFQPELTRALAGVRPSPARIRVYSTVRGGRAGAGDFDPAYWARSIRDPVLFGPAIAAAAGAGGTDYLEVGPHPILTGVIGQCLEGGGAGAVLPTLRRDVPERRSLLRALGPLFTRGYALDWSGVHPHGGRVVPLPKHPWRKQRYWFDPNRPRRSSGQVASDEGAPERG